MKVGDTVAIEAEVIQIVDVGGDHNLHLRHGEHSFWLLASVARAMAPVARPARVEPPKPAPAAPARPARK